MADTNLRAVWQKIAELSLSSYVLTNTTHLTIYFRLSNRRIQYAMDLQRTIFSEMRGGNRKEVTEYLNSLIDIYD